MFHLDFVTLYAVIFLKGTTISIVWCAFALKYRTDSAALNWFQANLLSLLGGAVLISQGAQGRFWPAVFGNTIIVFAFCHYLIGLRRFNDCAGGRIVAIGFSLCAFFCMVIFKDHDRIRSIIYATGQTTVMASCAYYLFINWHGEVGAKVSSAAFVGASLGQILVIIGNICVIANIISFSLFYQLASFALLCTIFCSSVWNLGFAIMMVEKLQNGLSRLSETDELTGVANRRAFYRLLTLEEQRALASNTTFSVIVTDLDQFKAINDTYGHAEGDRVLIEFSRLVADTVGPRDLVARLGGDEFGIVLPSAERVEALELVNQIRGSLEKNEVELAGQMISLSASMGAAEWEPGEPLSDLLNKADSHLYADKRSRAQQRQIHSLPVKREGE